MKSNELVKLISADGGKDYEFKPNSEIVAPKGKFKLWGDAHIKDEENNTICHLRVLDFKEGSVLPSCMFPIKKKTVKAVANDSL